MLSTFTIITMLAFLFLLGWLLGPKMGPRVGKTLVKIDMSTRLSKSKLEEKSLTLPDGQELWYLERPGNEQSPNKPLVVVPGLSVDMHLMGVQLADLLNNLPNRRVVIFELPYHGKRASMIREINTVGCSVHTMTASLEDLLSGLGLSEPFDLLGYSLGGAIATNFAVRHPNRIHRLVLLAPYYDGEATTDGYEATFASKQWRTLAAWDGRNEMKQWFCQWLGLESKDMFPGIVLSGLAALRAESYSENHWTRFYDQLDIDGRSTRSFLQDNKGALRKLPCPVLLYAAASDMICDPGKLTGLVDVFNPELCTIKTTESGHWFAPNGRTLFEITAQESAEFLND